MPTMRHRLSGFLVRLGDEPDLFEEYVKNREGVMERAGVAAADRAAILSGDLREIRTRVAHEQAEPEKPKPPVVMEPEEPEPEKPPTVMEPEEPEPEKPPVVMEPEPPEPPTVMDPTREQPEAE
jgi:hypothetical protein